MDTKKIIAGTGHRPLYCPCKYDELHPWLLNIKKQLHSFLLKEKPIVVNTGMAIGWDTWLAEEAIKLSIKIDAYIPFKGQSKKWPSAAQLRYNNILEQANNIYYTSKNYYPDVFFDRDADLIRNANKIFALWNPKIKKGGTYHTICLAKKQKKIIQNFWQDYEK